VVTETPYDWRLPPSGCTFPAMEFSPRLKVAGTVLAGLFLLAVEPLRYLWQSLAFLGKLWRLSSLTNSCRLEIRTIKEAIIQWGEP
jgi:hypothetical protein